MVDFLILLFSIHSTSLQFEAAWALTNVTCESVEGAVKPGKIIGHCFFYIFVH